jgi:hypothetical protein
MRLALAIAIIAWSACAAPPQVLTRAHAHNDYLHARPLLDALEQGFCSVEADIYLVDGKLLVAHDIDKVEPSKTLGGLYLEPLAKRARANGSHVFDSKSPFMLLIDIKSEAEPTYAVLRQELERWKDVLTKFQRDKIITNAITIVLSGNRPIDIVAAESERLAGIDGRLPDLGTNPAPSLVPLVSDNWTKHFLWRGEGRLSEAERDKLSGIVTKAHQQGRRIRFWGVPDTPEGWEAMQAAGVDLINTDDLTGLGGFLRRAPARQARP